jgi:hypothetical protein
MKHSVVRNKQYGKKFEADLVKQANDMGFNAKRAWGSNGKSLGQHESVDMMIDDARFQCKTKQKLPQWLGYNPEHMDGVIFKTLRGQAFVLIPYIDYLTLFKLAKPKEEEQLGGLSPIPKG